MNTPDKVIQIAMNEVGYLEKSKSAYMADPNVIYEKTRGAGHDNYTKYGYEMHKIYPGVMDFPAYWCFTKGTFLLTDKGYKPIEEIEIGDKVLNAQGDTFNTVIDKASRLADVVSVRTYGSLPQNTTGDHPFLSRKRLGVRKDWKKTPVDFNPISELKKGDDAVIPITKITNNVCLSYDEAWCIGYFVGDGWITTKGDYRICGDDKKEQKIYLHFKGIKKDADYKSRTCHEYKLIKDRNERILPFLEEVGKGASNKVVPHSILYASDDIKQAFLDGYMDADGTKDGLFSTVSKALALGISKIVYDLGYGCAIRECHRIENQKIFDKRINDYRDIHIKPIIYCGKINKNTSKAHRMDRREDGLVFLPITHIEEQKEKETVYNITTDNDHTYLANNLSVHNCDSYVDWCFYKAYGVATAKSLLGGNFDDYTVASANMYKKKNAWYSSPLYGDQIFFKNSTRICHTGFVYAVDSSHVYTLEGNTTSAKGVVSNGGCVAKKSYPLNYSNIAGYGRPKYDKAKKSIDEVARDVINGKYGVMPFRKKRIEADGYNYEEVRRRVNEIMKKGK